MAEGILTLNPNFPERNVDGKGLPLIEAPVGAGLGLALVNMFKGKDNDNLPEKTDEDKKKEEPPEDPDFIPEILKLKEIEEEDFDNLINNYRFKDEPIDFKKLYAGEKSTVPTSKKLIKKYKAEGLDLMDAIKKGMSEHDDLQFKFRKKRVKEALETVNVYNSNYVDLLDESIKLTDLDDFKFIKEMDQKGRSDLSNKVRARYDSNWAEANFGENFEEVLQNEQAQALKKVMQDIDPNIKERTVVDDIDDMNQANIDEFFGRKKNADGGIADLLKL
mgnify:FL=1